MRLIFKCPINPDYGRNAEGLLVNTSRKIRRLALAMLVASTSTSTVLTTGCASSNGGFSLSSVNPFSGNSETVGSQSNPSPLRSVATSTKNAWGKSKNAVTGIFKGETAQEKALAARQAESNVDPLRLDRKTNVGPEVYVANGRLWESTGNRQKAMESYVKALEVKPNDGKALAAIARLHHSSDEHTKAIDFFSRAISQEPEEATLHNDLGLTYAKSGNKAAAVASLTRALEISPGTSRYANNLATIKFDLGKTDEAFAVLKENNKPAVAHYNMAYLYQERGQTDDAKMHLTEAMKYKNEGSIDSSIARAVNRSQEMLAKLEGGKATPASAVKPPQTAIVKSTPAQLPAATIRQTSQSTDKNSKLSVTPALASNASPSSTTESKSRKRVQASFATARLGSKTEPVVKPAAKPVAETKAAAPSEAPKSAGGFTLPPGFGTAK